ncbi:MAG: homoserine dehydrogenase [Fusobacteriaceae bacterium]
MIKTLNIGILGYGSVGNGVVYILEEHFEKISQVTGYKINISKILVRDLEKKRKYNYNNFTLTTDPNEILDDDDISIIIEVMGGITLAKEYILKALNNGKNVVTANKDLISNFGNELNAIAKKNSCDLFYEASVGGGIPIVKAIVNGFSSDKIQKISGILNGTSNYILTRMKNDKKTYDDALKEVQKLGFAESKLADDVEGIDTARKLAILARLSFGMSIPVKDIYTIGINNLKQKDFSMADKFDHTIKLIGIAEEVNGNISARVGPIFIPNKHPLSRVDNENNSIFIKSHAIGETMFFGPGAGELPAAASIVSDIITISQNIKLGTTGTLFNNFTNKTKQLSKSQIFSKYYFRFTLKNIRDIILKFNELLLENDIKYEKIIQTLTPKNEISVTILTFMITKQHVDNLVNRLHSESNIVIKSKYEIMGD